MQPARSGKLSYKVTTTAQTGNNRAISVNAGEIEIRNGVYRTAIWQSQFTTTSDTRITIELSGELENQPFSCDLNIP